MTEATTSTESCAACRNWREVREGVGECRAHAPQLIVFEVDDNTKIESRFPTTAGDDWCGDFQAK